MTDDKLIIFHSFLLSCQATQIMTKRIIKSWWIYMFRTKHVIAPISRLSSLQWSGLPLANAKLNCFDRNL